MKIAFYADALDYQYAGIYFYLRNLLDALHTYGEKHEYVLVKSNPEERYPKFDQKLVPTSNFSYVNRFFRYVHTFPNIMAEYKPDVVIESTHFGPFRLPDSIRRVAIIHDITAVSHPRFHPRLSAFVQTNFLEDVAQNADFVITNSEYTKTQVVYEFGMDRRGIDVLYPVVPMFDKKVRSLNPMLDSPYILHVGTLEPRKNLDQLVRAFDRVRPEHDMLKLVLVGKPGWKTSKLNKAIANAKWKEDIIMTDYVTRSELFRWYDYAELCVFPSHIEGFGIPVAEALSRGCRVLCNDHGSFRESGSDYVSYVKADDLSSLCLKIEAMLRQKSRIDIPSSHLRKFQDKRIAKRFEDMISGAL